MANLADIHQPSSLFFLSLISWFAVPDHRVQRCPAIPPGLLLQRRLHKISRQRWRDHQRWGFISCGHAHRHPLGRLHLFVFFVGSCVCVYVGVIFFRTMWMCVHAECVPGIGFGSTNLHGFLLSRLIDVFIQSDLQLSWADEVKLRGKASTVRNGVDLKFMGFFGVFNC